jgi:hypothetical protein
MSHTIWTAAALLLAAGLAVEHASAQSTFEITIPVPGLTNVAGGHPLPDGGFVFGGELDDGLVVVRTDSTGAVLWTRALAEAVNEEGLYDRSIAVSGDRIFMGGYAMGPGTSSRDGILHVLDFDGNVTGQRLIDVAGGSNAVHGLTAIPGGALIAGRREGAGSYDMLLQQVDLSGNVTGSWGYGSTGWDWAYEAIQLSGGGRALVGYGDDVGGSAPSAYLVKTDAAGQELWARGLDGASADEGYCVMEDPATGDLYIGGRTLGMGAPGIRGFITKFNSSGGQEWTRVINNAFDVIGITASAGRLIALTRAQDIQLGHGNYDALLIAFTPDGQIVENRLYGSTASEYPVSLSRTAQDGLLVTSFKGTPGNGAIHAVLTDGLFNGACTGISVQEGWGSYQPNVFPHSSTQQSGQSMSSWVTPYTEPAAVRGFVCCTFPVDGGFTMVPTGNPLTWHFISNSPMALTHEWNLDGTTYNSPTFTHTFSAPGVQLVCLAVQGICDDASDCEVLNVSSTGISDVGSSAALSLTPNPTSGSLRISLEGEERITRVQVCDAVGRVVMDLAVNASRAFELDAERLQAGPHLLRVQGPNVRLERRFVKL